MQDHWPSIPHCPKGLDIDTEEPSPCVSQKCASTASTVAGGTAGWVGGATAGAGAGSFVPIIGTAVEGIVGGLLGSFAAGSAASKVSNVVLSDFSKMMSMKWSGLRSRNHY